MESQPQIPEFRNNPENLHPCVYSLYVGEISNITKEISKIFGF